MVRLRLKQCVLQPLTESSFEQSCEDGPPDPPASRPDPGQRQPRAPEREALVDRDQEPGNPPARLRVLAPEPGVSRGPSSETGPRAPQASSLEQQQRARLLLGPQGLEGTGLRQLPRPVSKDIRGVPRIRLQGMTELCVVRGDAEPGAALAIAVACRDERRSGRASAPGGAPGTCRGSLLATGLVPRRIHGVFRRSQHRARGPALSLHAWLAPRARKSCAAPPPFNGRQGPERGDS